MADEMEFTFTHKQALAAIRKNLNTAKAVQKALHPTGSTPAEKAAVKQVIDALVAAENALAPVNCPNGFLSIVTIDKAQLKDIGDTL